MSGYQNIPPVPDDSNKNLRIMPFYYENLYPYHLIYKWLSYGDPNYFRKREIALRLFSGSYIRFRSFETGEELINYLRRKYPAKIDIGSVYNIAPIDFPRAKGHNATEKELVFDIDMNDYDEVRTCCFGTDVCNKCWKFIDIACQILERILRDDFGYNHILWVFSGRRGVHCWVCDAKARVLTNKERIDLVSYIDLISGGVGILRRVKLPTRSLHSSIKRALDIINKNFVEFIIKEQNILGTDEGFKKFLSILQDGPKESFEDAMSQFTDSESRWNAFLTCLDGLIKKNCLPDKFKYLKEEVILHYAYPRLDGNVTRRLDHLLKSPFCVHPETGKISIVLDPKKVGTFDLNNIPTIELVLEELDQHFKRTYLKYSSVDENLKNTCLNKSVVLFKKFIAKLEIDIKKENNERDLEF